MTQTCKRNLIRFRDASLSGYVREPRTQISLDNGFRKLNTPGFCLTGFLIIIEMPRDMKGLLKSITRSRSDVIVIDAIAISASCARERCVSV